MHHIPTRRLYNLTVLIKEVLVSCVVNGIGTGKLDLFALRSQVFLYFLIDFVSVFHRELFILVQILPGLGTCFHSQLGS